MDPQKVTIAFGDNNVHIYRRERSSVWQCSVCLDGDNHRTSTKQKNLALAAEAAELFFLKHRLMQLLRPTGQTIQQFLGVELAEASPAAVPEGNAQTDKRRTATHSGAKFPEAVELFLNEYPILTGGERNKAYVAGMATRIQSALMPYFKDMYLTEITEGAIADFLKHRIGSRTRRSPFEALSKKGGGTTDETTKKTPSPPKPLSRSTLHKDIVTLRLVLKAAKRNGLISSLPDMTRPYVTSKKVVARPWFSPEEYKQLYEATRELARNPGSIPKADAEDLHDLVLFAGNTGLRPDELGKLQVRDVRIDDQEMCGTEILIVTVAEGKMGFGPCKSMPGAVEPFRRVLRRRNPRPEDKLFPTLHRKLFNAVLIKTGLKASRDGQLRTLYSLRHTYICMRLLEGARYGTVARNCRTGPDMIEKFYGSHIKGFVDVADLNVQRPSSVKRKAKKRQLPDA